MTESLVLDGNIEPDLAEFLKEQNFIALREHGGVIYGVCKFAYTFGLCTDVTWSQAHKHRWCFKEQLSAILSLHVWNLQGDPPGPWAKQKYMVERHNPLLYTHKGGTWWERNNVSDWESWGLSKNVMEGSQSLIRDLEATRVAGHIAKAV